MSPPSETPANGDKVEEPAKEAPAADPQAQPQRPPLGRHASVGDSQPRLGERQLSDARAPFAAAVANGATDAPKPVPGLAAVPPRVGVPTNPVEAAALSHLHPFHAVAAATMGVAHPHLAGIPGAQVTVPPRPYMDAAASRMLPTAGEPPRPVGPPNILGGDNSEAKAEQEPKATQSPASSPTSTPPVAASNSKSPEGDGAEPKIQPQSESDSAKPATSTKGDSPPSAPSEAPSDASTNKYQPAGEARPKSQARPSGGMKELRVEDALLYLDDVKREFGDRPRVYNEFLAIMKNFKSEEVDTPGVIARVSKLFRGYNNLILGFNKFLPDDFKISLKDLQKADAAYEREQEELKRQAALANASGAMGIPPQQPAGMPPAAAYPPQAQTAIPVQPSAAVPSGQPTGQPQVQLPVEGVRRSPVEQMDVTRSAQLGGPPRLGVAHPAAGYPSLANNQPQQQPTQPRPPIAAPPQPPARPQPVQPQRQIKTAVPPQQPAPQQPQQQQAVEFDHAISYVTTIKRRFSNDPSTYHSFLEILHTYQKEQRGIKEVLEQVAHLFQDHPDLLKEFTFFLPDAVQEQAKERLHRAAADSEARQAAQRAQLEQQQRGPDDMDIDPSGKHKLIDMTAKQAAEQAEPSRGKKRGHKESSQEAPTPIQMPQQPETYVYNSAVERQFFDAAREALASYTRDGGQAWAEFLKCLDMYAQEILSRSEMLNFVEPLLGKRNNKLFEEFKRIINSAGAQSGSMPTMEDSWYSVPLSEIDFSRCRRCSPSYRALPRDYPTPPTSERSDEEAKVLNDVWVSLPVGSEESYTFRHMRRNTFEEVLFRCEDERFEIDMVIDSNAATLARLEPIAEEIAQLSEAELVFSDSSNIPKPAPSEQGMGGKRFQYSFDKKILGVIHRNSIARIYGDAGQEVLQLIVKNPTVTVPVVVERLRQKDLEWKMVRDRLNRRWRELAEHNYYRSLDNRSLTWRTTDKRAISTRTLVSEIKDRAAHGGSEGPAAFQARMDKAKEEYGGFYETTMGSRVRRELDLTNLPKPDRRLFTPHLSLMYENTGWVHRDAYRLLMFALERGNISPADKERCHRMWFEFLGPWFNLSTNWMMSPAVKFQENTTPMSANDLKRIVSNGDERMTNEDEESLDEDNIPGRVVTEVVQQVKPNGKNDSPSYMDHHPLPPGANVSTIYGDGQVIKCRRSDHTYVVSLPFGKAYLRPSAVLCSLIPAERSAYTAQLRVDDRTKLERPGDQLVIGTQAMYLFFRLHQILVTRLGVAKHLAYTVRDDPALVNMVEQLPGTDVAALGKRRYESFLSLVFSLLEGGHTLAGSAAEGGKYEDRVRSLLGHGGFALATMDKLISHILKNLQSMANDDTMWNLVQLYRRHLAAGSFKAEAFRQEAGFLSDGEQMYAFQHCPVQKDGGDKSVLHMEYLGVVSDQGDVSMTEAPVETHNHSKRHKKDR